jgi:hypothetical protein
VARRGKERLMRTYLLVSGIVFGAVALAHLLRLIFGWPVQLGTEVVPMWISIIGVVLAGALCGWAFALVREVKDP